MSASHLVGIAQMRISQDPEDLLVAPNLGSCVGVAIYDPIGKRGGLIHCLLPLSKTDPIKAANNPCMYVDTGVTTLLERLIGLGADKKRLIITAAGGANINDDGGVFAIGKKNCTILKKILWKNNLLLRGEHIGEDYCRTISLSIATGQVSVKTPSQIIELSA